MELYTTYTWIVALGAIVAFFMAYGIGANDVANSFGTSVGSKALKLWHAVIIAGVCEFLGAMLLGAPTARTIAGSIAKNSAFERNPEILMYGMLCALSAAAIWLIIATYLEYAVSTTHSIVGAVMGFSLVYGGANAIVWAQPKEEFPYLSGVAVIVMSWFISPVACGLISSVFFLIVRTIVLRRKNSTKLAYWLLPVLVFITVYINAFFVMFKGAAGKYQNLADSPATCAWISAIVAAGASLFTIAVVMPFLNRKLKAWMAGDRVDSCVFGDKDVESNKAKSAAEVTVDLTQSESSEPEQSSSFLSRSFKKMKSAAIAGVSADIHDTAYDEDEAAVAVAENAEKFDPATEHVLSYLQVFTAMCDSFSHGANDVANSIGPFAAIWQVYTTQMASSRSTVPEWILAIGAFGIVVGLATYGYKIIRAIGVKLVHITPSRGFCVELGTAWIISLGSMFGLPLSTTHCQVGGTAGVGLVEGRKGVNWKLLLKTFGAWVMTLVVAALLSAALFSAGAFAPSIPMARQIDAYENGVLGQSRDILKVLNSTNLVNCTAPDAPTCNLALNETIASLAKDMKTMLDPKKTQTLYPDDVLGTLAEAVGLYQNNSIINTLP